VSFAQVKSHRRYQQVDASAKQRPAAYGGTLVKAAGCAERMNDGGQEAKHVSHALQPVNVGWFASS
jgi:hypothetical protein